MLVDIGGDCNQSRQKLMFFDFSSRRKTDAEKPKQSSLSFHTLPVAGAKVNEDTAFTYSAFWACVKIISETIACLPWHVYQHGHKSKYESGHWLDDILYRRPNDEMNAFVYKRLTIANLLAYGNSYAEIERNQLGQIVNLWPIVGVVQVDRDSRGRLVYDVQGDSGDSAILSSSDVYHVRGPSRDGILGMSVVQQARESISLGLAAESFGSSFFGGGGLPGLVIKDPEKKSGLDPTGVKNLLKKFNKKGGVRDSARVEYLDSGLEVQVVGMPLADAQFLETRKFQISEMCRWFRIPLHKLADLERSTHNNIESQNIEFVTDAVLPNTKCLESESDFRLLGDEGRKYYTKMNVMGLLRGDTQARKEYYKALEAMGVLSIDDIRDKEDMDLIGGDVGNLRLVPANMTTPDRMISGEVGNPNKSGSMNALFEEIAARFCKIELKKVSKFTFQTTDNEIVNFYTDFARNCADGFYRTTNLFLEFSSKKNVNANEVLQQFFGTWCANAADTIAGSLKRDNLNSVLVSWEASRAKRLARDLCIRLSEA